MNLWEKISFFASNKTPFLVIIDFDCKNGELICVNDFGSDIMSSFCDFSENQLSFEIKIDKNPVSYEDYLPKILQIYEQIKAGNVYLLNYTEQTEIISSASLRQIYNASRSKFKLFYKDKFVCFSPERFVKIEDNKIKTFPMKGTIDASLPNATDMILSNEKEMAEHTMVVDLLRNDLSKVSTNVKVERFRYIDEICAGEKNLLQVSSEICGCLENGWQQRLGQILRELLPAGSISGTPKKEAIKIIKNLERYDRGFFTGVFGFFDGENFDSAVMIRFIEKTENGLIYKSGGGITADSDPKSEYQEMIDKVYVPTK